MRLQAQRQKMMEDQRKAKEERLRETQGVSSEDKARILREFDETNRRLEAALISERERQAAVLQRRLDGRKTKLVIKRQYELDADIRAARSEHAKKVAAVAQGSMFALMQGALTRARGVSRAVNKLKGTLASIRAKK